MNPFSIMLAIYLMILVILGWLTRRARSPSDFFLASRSLGAGSVAMTIGATTLGGSAVIVTAGLVYSYGLPGLWYDIAGAMGLMALGIWIAPKIRGVGAHSLPDLIGRIYGDRGRNISSVVLLLVEIGWIALLLQATMWVLSIGLSVSTDWALVIACLVFIGYTSIGGQMAVVRTDVLQIILIFLSLFLLGGSLIVRGASIDFSGLEFPVSEGFGWSALLSAAIMMFLSHLVGPDIYSKILSSRSGRSARYGALIDEGIKLSAGIIIGIIVLLAISLYGGGLESGEVLPRIASDGLSPLLESFVLIGLISVTLSSADSCLLSGATFLSWDLIDGRGGRPLWIISIALIGTLAYGVAFLSPGIISTLILSYTLFSAAIAPSVLLAPWKEKLGLDSLSAGLSFFGGAAGVITLFILQLFGLWDGSLLYLPLGISFLALLGIPLMKALGETIRPLAN